MTAKLGGKPLDLFVMTHEHLDHVQGFLYAAEKLNKTIKVKQAWLTGSAAPDYYTTHQRARKQKIAALMAYQVDPGAVGRRRGRDRRSWTSCWPTTTPRRRRSASTSCATS